jgi:hypothetical protein
MRSIWTLFLSGFLAMYAMSGYELAQNNDNAMSGFEDSIASMQMTLINANDQQRVRELHMQTLEKEGGDMSLMEFLSPADVLGTKFLNHEHLEKDDDQWLYLPAIKRVKRIASKNKSGAFMGSEFSYEDLSSFNIDKYTYESETQKSKLGTQDVYISTRIPKDKNSGYTKQITYIDAHQYLTKKVDYFDRKSALLKTATFSEYKKIKGVWRIGKIVMKNHQNGKQTTLVWKDETIKNGLNEKDFTKRKLR